MNPTTDLPDDAALPGIVAMRALGVTRRALGLARALLALGLEDAPHEAGDAGGAEPDPQVAR